VTYLFGLPLVRWVALTDTFNVPKHRSITFGTSSIPALAGHEQENVLNDDTPGHCGYISRSPTLFTVLIYPRVLRRPDEVCEQVIKLLLRVLWNRECS
jgi:hypothetical protein